VLRVRDAVITSIRRFFDERGFINVDAPMFTPNACEGTSEAWMSWRGGTDGPTLGRPGGGICTRFPDGMSRPCGLL
jgi:hypothetical protein